MVLLVVFIINTPSIVPSGWTLLDPVTLKHDNGFVLHSVELMVHLDENKFVIINQAICTYQRSQHDDMAIKIT